MPSRRGPRLDRAAVVAAAIALVDREGAASLTMRRLGAELGIEAMSLYTHVAGREALLDAMSEALVQALVPAPTPADWREALRGFAAAIRGVALAYPQAFLLVGMRPLRGEQALDPVERLLGTLADAGFEPALAVAAYRLVTAYARGFALAEIQGFTLDPGGGEAISVGPAHPAIADVLATPGALDRDGAFALGLEAVVSGLDARRRG